MSMSEFERGQRDMLDRLLALNPEASRGLAAVGGGSGYASPEGKLPFDVLFWICKVAEQTGLQPREPKQSREGETNG